MSVLAVSVILLAMAGAFFLAHKSDLALMGTSVKIEKTKNAALSAAEFMQYKLENDRFFGVQAFSIDGTLETFPQDAESPKLEIEYISEDDDPSSNLVRGRVLGTGLEFEAQLMNNLNRDAVGYHPRGEAPPRSARVWITAEKDQVIKRMDFILKRSPFTSVSMLSGGDIGVSLTSSEDGHWWLGARQPSGNGVRANGTIRGPEVLSRQGRAVLFEPPQGMADKLEPPYGVIQGKNLSMQMNGVRTNVDQSMPELEQAEENIRGVLSPGGGEVKVPELDVTKMAAPTQTFQMPANKVTFKSVEKPNGIVEHQLLEDGNVKAVYDGGVGSNRQYTWQDGSGLIMATFDLESRVMKVTENVELKSGGQFVLEAGGNSSSRQAQPTLVLGTQQEAASIEATGIEVKGSVGGMGALKAGDGDLRIRAKSSLSTTPDFGVALHSNRDVVLSKPGKSNQDGIPADWDAFAKAVGSYGRSGRLNGWADKSEVEQKALASNFSRIELSEAGQVDASSDPIWLGLTKEFPADQTAKQAYDEWIRPEVPEITEERIIEEEVDPDVTDGGDPTTGGSTDATTGGSTDATTDGSTDATTGGEPPPPRTETVVVQERVPPGPGMDVEKYVRLREYLKTVKAGKPDETWLTSDEPNIQLRRRADVQSLIQNQMSSFQLAAGQTATEVDGHVTLSWNSLTDYFTGKNPFLAGYFADMKFRGLIYAGGNFNFNTEKLGIELEGAVVAQNDINISNATGARFIYNSELLEDLFATNEGDASAKLERAFWAYY